MRRFLGVDAGAETVKAIIGLAPGPPANLQAANATRPDETAPDFLDETEPVRFGGDAERASLGLEFFRRRYASAPLFPVDYLEQNFMGEVPESARIRNQRQNKDGAGLHLADPRRLREVDPPAVE